MTYIKKEQFQIDNMLSSKTEDLLKWRRTKITKQSHEQRSDLMTMMITFNFVKYLCTTRDYNMKNFFVVAGCITELILTGH